MAVRKIAMVVNLRQNKNQTAANFGKWYPEVDEKKPLDLKGFLITGSVLLIIFYVENLDVGSWGVKNDV